MTAAVHVVAMEQVIPAGIMGPGPVTLDVRAFLVPHGSGVVLVDTGMDPAGRALDEGLSAIGAAWSDVSHIVLTHAHPDHVGALAHARTAAAGAVVLAGPSDAPAGTRPAGDGDVVGSLRVVATPGHTAGHLSLLDEAAGVLLVGDCLGSVAGRLVRAPAQFTADPDVAEQTLHGLSALRGARMLFGHGPELSDPWGELDRLLEGGRTADQAPTSH